MCTKPHFCFATCFVYNMNYAHAQMLCCILNGTLHMVAHVCRCTLLYEFHDSTAAFISISDIASINMGTVIAITFAVTFVTSLSLGLLVATIIMRVCFTPRVSSVTTQAPPTSISTPIIYESVGINQKPVNAIELESNAAYGVAR